MSGPLSNLFFRDRRLLLLFVSLITVAGLSSLYVLPQMEDPPLTQRVAMINTRLPGADAQRVESLVTEKLEEEIQEVEEIKELRSMSRTGISTITVELRDDVYDSAEIWSRIRDKLADATPLLPQEASDPYFDELEVRAYALIVSLNWEQDTPPNYAILRRLGEELEDRLRALPGTEDVDLFGDPDEEVLVTVKPEKLAALGLTFNDVATQLRASDAKVSAGQLRGPRGNLILEVDSELATLARIGQTPIQYGDGGNFVQLSDLATIDKSVANPPKSLALVSGKPAVALAVLVRSGDRIDHWSEQVHGVLDQFSDRLPPGVQLATVFEQNEYVQARLENLLGNLLLGAAAVVVVIFFMMGWRSALVVSSALPLTALMVLAGLRFLDIPIHQMSVTGLIIALGLLIDNAIVMVDEVNSQLRSGKSPAEAVSHSVRHLAIPLFGSTVTTALAFAPIALMPGPAGEFVGSIAVSVILAIFSSLLLAMTVVPAIAAIGRKVEKATESRHWWRQGYSNPKLTRAYRSSLDWLFAHPVWAVALGLVLPIAGFVQARQLPEQFFPPADRDQFQVEVILPSQASLEQTEALVQEMRSKILSHEGVQDVHVFLGESAPSFYYNVIPRRKNTANYAQALVQLDRVEGSREIIRALQRELDAEFPMSQPLVRQLEQGPPFNAPVELRLFGPDLDTLRELGDQVRGILAEQPNVIHTSAELSEAQPKLAIKVDEEEARLAGLDHQAIAQQLDATLEGAVGGSVLESMEELPVRVRLPQIERGNLNAIASLDLLPPGASRGNSQNGTHSGVPLSSLAKIELVPEVAAIPRMNNRRMNEVQAFITAGVLPAEVLTELQRRLAVAEFKLPPGYTLSYGGEADKRDQAIGNLMANVGILMVMMVATLVLSFGSFRVAGLVGLVGFLSVGLGLGALWVFGYPFGFMAIVGTMGLIGVAINDAIVVLAALREDPAARQGDVVAVREVVLHATRHVVATSLTTMAGFAPLVMAGGGFWPPLAVAIAGGVGGATLLALYVVPAAYILVMCRQSTPQSATQHEAAPLMPAHSLAT